MSRIAIIAIVLVLMLTSSVFCQMREADPLHSKAVWQTKLESISNFTSVDEFQSTVDKWRGFTPHVARSVYGIVSSRVGWCNWLELDEDWTIVWQPSIGARIVGVPDLSHQIPVDQYEAIRAIHRSPTLEGEFDPVNLIRAVNILQAMGEKRAIEAMKAYCMISESNPQLESQGFNADRVFWLTRLLYISNDPFQPIAAPQLGAPSIDVKRSSQLDAVFPLVLQNDIPFRLNSGYLLGGYRASPIGYLDFCRTIATFRSEPLRPTTDALTAASTIIHERLIEPAISSADIDSVKEDLRGQAICASENVLGDPRELCTYELLQFKCTDDQWASACELNRVARTAWSALCRDFVRVTRESLKSNRPVQLFHPQEQLE